MTISGSEFTKAATVSFGSTEAEDVQVESPTQISAIAPPGTGSASGSKSLTGWTVGAGWEYAWTDHWTFKLEYLFASFPTTNGLGAIADTAGGTNPLHGSADLVIQTLRAGVNFKF